MAAPLLDLVVLNQHEFDTLRSTSEKWKLVQRAVPALKAAAVTKPALGLHIPGGEGYLVRTDASDFPIGATLRQCHPGLASNGEPEHVDRILAFYSRKLHDAETRYSIYDKGDGTYKRAANLESRPLSRRCNTSPSSPNSPAVRCGCGPLSRNTTLRSLTIPEPKITSRIRPVVGPTIKNLPSPGWDVNKT